MSSDERLKVYVGIHSPGCNYAQYAHPTPEAARDAELTEPDRIAECHELRDGETILTAAQYRDIAQFAGSLWSDEVREVAAKILGIIDGERP